MKNPFPQDRIYLVPAVILSLAVAAPAIAAPKPGSGGGGKCACLCEAPSGSGGTAFAFINYDAHGLSCSLFNSRVCNVESPQPPHVIRTGSTLACGNADRKFSPVIDVGTFGNVTIESK